MDASEFLINLDQRIDEMQMMQERIFAAQSLLGRQFLQMEYKLGKFMRSINSNPSYRCRVVDENQNIFLFTDAMYRDRGGYVPSEILKGVE